MVLSVCDWMLVWNQVLVEFRWTVILKQTFVLMRLWTGGQVFMGQVLILCRYAFTLSSR